MKISLNWLSQYIDLSGLSVDEMSDMLTFAGIEVEDIRQQGVDSPYVVVARVAAAEQHPQADRLKVCQVDVGDGTLRRAELQGGGQGPLRPAGSGAARQR